MYAMFVIMSWPTFGDLIAVAARGALGLPAEGTGTHIVCTPQSAIDSLKIYEPSFSLHPTEVAFPRLRYFNSFHWLVIVVASSLCSAGERIIP